MAKSTLTGDIAYKNAPACQGACFVESVIYFAVRSDCVAAKFAVGNVAVLTSKLVRYTVVTMTGRARRACRQRLPPTSTAHRLQAST